MNVFLCIVYIEGKYKARLADEDRFDFSNSISLSSYRELRMQRFYLTISDILHVTPFYFQF